MECNRRRSGTTVAHRWRAWIDPRLPLLVLDSGDLNEVTWEQREMEGDPKFAASQTVPQVPYADYAQSLGLGATKVASPTEVVPAWDAALAADRPFLIHAVVDPAVPLVPPRLEPTARARLLDALDHENDALASRARALLLSELADQEA